MLDFSALKTPAEDGDLLIAPDPPRLTRLLEENRKKIERWDVPVLGVGVGELRRRVRRRLAGDSDAPLVMTGHQPDFTHPGVWAKHAVARTVADRIGAQALNLVVDQDAPKETALVIPVKRDSGLGLARVPYAEMVHERPFERIPALTGKTLHRFADSVGHALEDALADSSVPMFLSAFSAAGDAGGGLVSQMVAGRRAIDTRFDAAYQDRRVSVAWSAWHGADLILNASRFSRAYNEALGDYRRQLGIKSSTRPMPDLGREGNLIELPLWAYGPGGIRRRVWVEPGPDHVGVFAERDCIGRLRGCDLGSLTSAGQAVRENLSAPLRPRALTLTLWARMFACDLFVHGIGGAKYDRITDGIIQRYYGVSPPAYACASATLHMPFAGRSTGAADLPAARWRVRDARHNPQRYVGPHPDLVRLEGAVAKAVRHSQALRAARPHDHSARREAWRRIRELKANVLALKPGVLEGLMERAGEVEAQLACNRIAAGREYFVGLYPREKVARLAAGVRARWSGV